MEDEEIKIYRIRNNGVPFFPVSIHNAIIGLQSEIKKKLPITSSTEPEAGTYVKNQVWLDTNESNNEETPILGNYSGEVQEIITEQSENEVPIVEQQEEIPIIE